MHFAARYAKKPYGALGKKWMIAVLAVAISLLFLGITLVYWFVKARKQGMLNSSQTYRSWILNSSQFSNSINLFNCLVIGRKRDRKFSFRLSFEDSPNQQEFDTTQNTDLPFFDLSTIAAATDNFSNKLGQGGFGAVYKVCKHSSLTSSKLNNIEHRFKGIVLMSSPKFCFVCNS